MASGRTESSPYWGVQETSGGFVVEKRKFVYQGVKYEKFYRRTKGEREAAFIWDFLNYVLGTNNNKFNFGNGRKVLEEHGPRSRQELEVSLAQCNWAAMDEKEQKAKLRECLIHEAKELWNEHKGEILQDHIRPLHKGSRNNEVELPNHGHEDSVQEQDHIRPLHEGSRSNEVELLNHGHEDSVQEQDHIRSLHNGSSNITSEQLNHGYENFLAGECSMTKQSEENGGSPKFDVDGALAQLKKKLPLPPSLEKDPQSSFSQAQEDPNEGFDARGQNTGQNLENKMEIRRDGYNKWLKITYEFLESECSSVKVSDVLNEIDSTVSGLPKICAQIQCAEYEKIVDAVNDVLKSELRIPKDILDTYWVETEPILEQCRADWYS